MINLDGIYKEIARAMLRELFEYLQDKDIKIMVEDVEIDIKFRKLDIREKRVEEE